jgi:Ceramidase
MRQKLLIRSFIATVTMLLIWFGFNQILDESIWQGMTLSKSALTVEYCEFNNPDRFFHQSMNTYSNLVYFFLGVLICQIAWEDYKNRNFQNRLANFPLLSALMGFCFIYLGIGSAFFHASLTWAGQRVDMNGTYSVTLTLVGIGLYHVLHKINFSEQAKKIWIITMVLIILSFYQIHLLISSSILVPVLILLMMVFMGINYFQFPKQRYILVGILSFVLIIIAVKIRTMDVQKINCDPHSWYQGHSVWHLLTGLSSFCTYAFFRFNKTTR